MKKPRKKISKKGWGIKWGHGMVNFYQSKRIALELMSFYDGDTRAVLFRCKIEEVTK